jgi:hypothetical protein
VRLPWQRGKGSNTLLRSFQNPRFSFPRDMSFSLPVRFEQR